MPRRHRFDLLQPLSALGLCGLGLITLRSVSASAFQRQLLFVLLAILAYAVMTRLDHRRLVAAAAPLYGVGIFGLGAVAILGHMRLGAQRWITLGGIPIEPSEMDKLVMIVVLAALLSREGGWPWRRLPALLAVIALPTGLVMLQPDLGTAIVFGLLFLGLFFIAGAPLRQLAALLAGALAAIPLLPHLLHGYQRQRLLIFIDPGRDPLGAGYNLIQARIAVGSGGLLGRGWMHGAAGPLGYVPARTTDFVFALYAEQFGLVGAVLLLGLFALLIWRLARAARQAPDPSGRLLCAGMAVVVAVQVIQNVGMNVGLTPIAGIPLPFLSSGGSSLISLAAGLGLVQSVQLRSRALAWRPPPPRAAHLAARFGTAHLGL